MGHKDKIFWAFLFHQSNQYGCLGGLLVSNYIGIYNSLRYYHFFTLFHLLILFRAEKDFGCNALIYLLQVVPTGGPN